jgi:hypothetical protein
MFVDFNRIRAADLGHELETAYGRMKQQLADEGLTCAYDCKTGRTFAFVTAALMNPLFAVVHRKNLRHPAINGAQMAMYVRDSQEKLVSSLTVEFELSRPMRTMVLTNLADGYTFSDRFQRLLGVVVGVQCTDDAHTNGRFLRLELGMLEMCIHDILPRDDPTNFLLTRRFRSVLRNPSGGRRVMLVVVCPRTDLVRIDDLLSIGMRETNRDWGVDRTYKAVFERAIDMPVSPMLPAV